MSSGEFRTVLGKNCFIKGKSTARFRAVPQSCFLLHYFESQTCLELFQLERKDKEIGSKTNLSL